MFIFGGWIDFVATNTYDNLHVHVSLDFLYLYLDYFISVSQRERADVFNPAFRVTLSFLIHAD